MSARPTDLLDPLAFRQWQESRTAGARLRTLYELAVRLESHGAIEPDPKASETDMFVAIEYALGTLADQRDRAQAARLEAEAHRDLHAKRVA